MQYITKSAMMDYNSNLEAIKSASIANKQDTIMSVIACGVGSPAQNVREVVNSNIQVVQPLTRYVANGSSTPLFDSVGELIDIFTKVPDYNDETVSFLIMVVTDGGDNSSRKWSGKTLGAKIRELQATDRWTFVFRVPRGMSRNLTELGIPAQNILEWDQTEQGVQHAAAATARGIEDFYCARTSGARSVQTFYANMSNVSVNEVKQKLVDISSEVSIWTVFPNEDGCQIRDFCEKRLGTVAMLKGAAFYELTKLEKKVQDYKQIAVRDKSTQMIYCGASARDLLGLPHVGDVKLAPGNHGNFDIFIQSTSVNRKLPAGSMVLYWPKIGQKFTEGPSAR
jgi:hypothetical protein